MTMHQAFALVAGFATVAVLGSWVYFRRYRPNLPPVGVCDLTDVAIMLGAIVLIPYLYLAIPSWTVAVLLAASFLSTLHLTLQPLLGGRWSLLLAGGLIAADVALAVSEGFTSPSFAAVNAVVMVIAVVGGTNIWAQTGMRARDVAVLAAGLTIYDAVAVWHLTLMDDLFGRLSNLPLVPAIAWPEAGAFLAVGLGDLLMAAVFPLVMRKAYGRRAGVVACASTLVVLLGMLALLAFGAIRTTVPAMVVLGPLMVAQYGYWRRSFLRGSPGQDRTERRTWEYLEAEPLVALRHQGEGR
jgi:hypothetical protein